MHAQKKIPAIDKLLPVIGGHLHDACVHADGIHGAGLHTEAAHDTAVQNNIKLHRIFLDGRVPAFTGADMDALRRTDGGAKHAGHTPWGTVFPLDQTMPGPVSGGDDPALFRILDGHGPLLAFHQAEQVRRMNEEIAKEVPCRDREPLHHFAHVEPFQESQ